MPSQPDDLPVARTLSDLRRHVKAWRDADLRVALVPTMGALHQGHLSLIDIARAHADRVIVSIFVNPTQFAPHEDFDDYPRQEKDDLEKLRATHAALAYIPTVKDMYPNGFTTKVSVSGISEGLCAVTRPHFFDGVTTVVTKLLIHAQPDVAVFGEKDFQQLLVITRLVEDLGFPVDIQSGPIVREDDGLAVSSRNQYLDSSQRKIAARFNSVLKTSAEAIVEGKRISDCLEAGKQALLDAGFDRVDYFELRSARDLTPLDTLTVSARLLGAAWLGKTRLIDNWPVAP